jgi:hypothetical protein
VGDTANYAISLLSWGWRFDTGQRLR